MSQEQKELVKGKKKFFSSFKSGLFRVKKHNNKNMIDIMFKVWELCEKTGKLKVL